MKKKAKTISNVPDTTVYLYANLYNEIVDSVHHYPMLLPISKEVTESKWYDDMLSLIKLIELLKCTPRDYIYYQIKEYKQPFYKSRKIPTVRMLASPMLVSKWQEYEFKKKQYKAPIIVSKPEMIEFSKQKMKLLMDKYNMSELAFFQDPVCLSQVSPDFLRSSKTFKTLFYSGYYKNTFGLEDAYILS